MKKLLLLIFFSGMFQIAFAQQAETYYAKSWLKIYQYELDELPKSALALVDSIYIKASTDNNEQQLIKALIYQSKFLLTLQEDAKRDVVVRFKEEIADADVPYKNILESQLARLYTEYYQANRWRIRNRTDRTSEKDSLDFRTWSEKELLREAQKHYQRSIENTGALKRTTVSDVKILINKYTKTDKERPTLYDMLVHDVISFNNDYAHNLNTVDNPPVVYNLKLFNDFLSFDLQNSGSFNSVRANLELYQKLLLFHQSDEEKTALVQVELERIKYLNKVVRHAGKSDSYVNALERLKTKYDSVPQATFFDLALASYYDNINDKNEALIYTKEAIERFPSSKGALLCKELEEHILRINIQVESKEFVPAESFSKLRLSYLNTDSVEVLFIKVAHGQFDKFIKLPSNAARIKFVENSEVAVKRKYNLLNTNDHLEHNTELLIPPLSSGHYIVILKVLNPEKSNAFAFEQYQVSDLALIRTDLDKKQRYQLINRMDGSPIKGGIIQIREFESEVLLASKTTDGNGFAYIGKDDGHKSISIIATHQGDTAHFGRSYISRLYNVQKEENNEYVEVTTALFTDRSIYRPGQKVYFKGILFKDVDGKKEVVPNEYVEVYLEDVNVEEVGYVRLKTNAYGSFSGEFVLPENGLNGEYTIYVDEDYEEESKFYDKIVDDFIWNEQTILVEEYKRPTFEVVLDPYKETAKLNDSIFLHGRSESFSGAPLSHAKVSYSVNRKVQFSNWYRYSKPYFGNRNQQIASGDLTAEADGGFSIPFKAVPASDVEDDDNIIFQYEVKVDVTDINGETRSTTGSVRVGNQTLEATLLMPQNINRVAEESDISFTITNLNNQPIDAEGFIKIYKLNGPEKPQVTRPWSMPDRPLLSDKEYSKYFPHEALSSDRSFENWKEGTLYDSIRIDSKRSKSTNLTFNKKWPLGRYKMLLQVEDSIGNKALTQKYFSLFDTTVEKVPDNQLIKVELDKSNYVVGEKAVLMVGTASEDMTVTLDIHKPNGVVETKIVHLSNEVKHISFPISLKEKNGFTIHYSFVNYDYYDKGTVNVPVSIKHEEFKIQTSTFRDKLLPGSEETWKFSIIGDKKEKRSVEVLASMYDASLDQFEKHKWSFSPNRTNPFYAYNNSNAEGFGSQRFFTRNLTNRYFRISSQKFNELHHFGLTFTGYSRFNRDYLNRLKLVFFTESTINQRQLNNVENGYVSGVVTSNTGEYLPRVNVLLKGTDKGVNSNDRGYYVIRAEKGDTLVFSFIGMRSVEVPIENNAIDVKMEASLQELSEVVVVGYGIQNEKRSLSASIVEVADSEVVYEMLDVGATLQGQVAGVNVSEGSPGGANTIMLRGSASLSTGEQPLFVVDGVVVDQANLTPDQIASINILKGASATALYGARAANGVVIVSTKAGQKKLDQLLAKVKARSDFRETAFFYPHLTTDKKGTIDFTFTTPEALTRWKLQLLAHNSQLKVGYKSLQTVTQKDLMIIPNAPRFLREGDEIEFSTKINNLTNNALSGSVGIYFENPETGEPVENIIETNLNSMNFTVANNNSTAVSWRVKVPSGLAGLQYKIVATTGDFSDGEQAVIPILPKKQWVIESLPIVMRTDKKSFNFKKLLENNSKTLKHHKLTFEFTDKPVWYAIQSMPYLLEYPYECSEQTFSRYYANLVAQHIIQGNPRIRQVFQSWSKQNAPKDNLNKNEALKSIRLEETPWLQSGESNVEQRRRLGALLDSSKLAASSDETLIKLEEMQLVNGGFPWFKGSSYANRHITQYIMIGLGQLQWIGVKGESEDLHKGIIRGGLSYLNESITNDYKRLQMRAEKEENFNWGNNHLRIETIQGLYAKSFFKSKDSSEVLKATSYFFSQIQEYWQTFDLQLKAMIALTAHRNGNDQLASSIRKSLKETSIISDDMGMYWKANVSDYGWSHSPIETQALLIALFSEIPAEDEEDTKKIMDDLKVWLLRNKQTNSWATTKATVQAIHALVDEKQMILEGDQPVQVTLGERAVDLEQEESLPGYYKNSWPKEEFDEKMGAVEINRTTDGLGFGALYWEYLEDLDKIEANEGALIQLKKSIYKVEMTSEGEKLREVADTLPLKVGDLIRVRIVLNVKQKMEFIHMKDQRASGLEPVTTISEHKWQDGLAYYQSTKDASTNFFFDKIDKGIYVFEYDLRINNGGDFSSGIATIQSMYAPEFSSHSQGQRISIEKQ